MKDLSNLFPITREGMLLGMRARANFRKEMVNREALKGWDKELMIELPIKKKSKTK